MHKELLAAQDYKCETRYKENWVESKEAAHDSDRQDGRLNDRSYVERRI